MNNKKLIRSSLALMISALAHEALANTPQLKIDLNMPGRPEAEVNEPGYTPWPVEGGQSQSQNFAGVNVTISHTGNNGTGLRADWYKAGVQAPYYARIANDGVTIDDGNNGAEITLKLTNLPAGSHTIQLYLNTVANPDNNTFAPYDIWANGQQVIDNFKPKNRVTSNADAATAFISATAVNGEITLRIKADTNQGGSNKNVVLNGFELNTPNGALQAKSPIPTDGDLHINADNGDFTLRWTKAPAARTHFVYMASDKSQVETAERNSAAYLGEFTDAQVAINNLNSLTTYYWRVDTQDNNGVVTRGSVWSFRPRQLAFPGAEGYGRFAIGGRGGKVIKVTNLNDAGAGSLRDAIEGDYGPRTIIFDVAGVIRLNSRLTLNDSFVTLAGQSAPGKGITIRGAAFGMSGVSDVIWQHIRVRVGAGPTWDGIGMAGSDHSIVDHASVSWTIDESFSSRNAKNITLQRTMLAEALNIAGHQNYPPGSTHGFAASISGSIGSFHHNLLAHNEGRNWSLAGGLDANNNFAGKLDIFNNVVYNWGGRSTDGGAAEVNFVNNYYKPGAATTMRYALNAQYEDNFGGAQQYYVAGNVIPGRCTPSNQQPCYTKTGEPFQNYSPWVNQPFFPSYSTVQSAEQAYKNVLSDVGASSPVLDDHDIRIINETLTGTYKYRGSESGKPGLPDHENDVGGFENYPETYRPQNWDVDNDGLPNWWEQLRGLDAYAAGDNFDDANSDNDGDGYTELEHYLHWLSNPNMTLAVGEQASVDLTKLFRGYTQNPQYSITNATGINAAINGGQVIVTASECGLASLEFSVRDSAGDTMNRTMGIHIHEGNNASCNVNAASSSSVMSSASSAEAQSSSASVVSSEMASSSAMSSAVSSETGEASSQGSSSSAGGGIQLGSMAHFYILLIASVFGIRRKTNLQKNKKI